MIMGSESDQWLSTFSDDWIMAVLKHGYRLAGLGLVVSINWEPGGSCTIYYV